MTTTKKVILRIGARIVKSSAGAAICMLIFFIREFLPIGSGIPFFQHPCCTLVHSALNVWAMNGWPLR